MSFRLLSFGKRENNVSYGPLLSMLMGTYIAVGFTLAMIFILYATLLMSPDLLRNILQDVMRFEDFSDNLSPNFTSGGDDTLEYSDLTQYHSETKSQGPAAAAAIPLWKSRKELKHVGALEKSPATAQQSEKFSVFVGVLTTAGASDRRHQLRLAYAVQSSDEADFTVRFVLGEMEKEEDRVLVGMENATFGDVIVLPCKENMNKGKSFAYFTTLVTMGVKYDYVMKTDDDAYVRLSNLAGQLSPMPRKDLYYGYTLPCDDEVTSRHHFIAGAGYMISWDLVLWINDSPIPRNKSIGVEDILVGDWFQAGGVAKNRPVTNGLFHDYPADYPCAHELRNNSVLVHKLKSSEQWRHVLAFFEKDRLSNTLKN